MLGGVKLKVCFTYEKTCFAYISPKYNTGNEQAQCIQVLCKEKPIFLWAVFGGNVAEGQMACNPIVGCLLGLSEGSEVFVSPHGDVKVLDELYIDADSPDDQEILEHNVENLQLRILDQLRLVVAYQKAVLWTTASLRIVITPKQTGLLVNNSRLIVKVDAFNMIRRKPVAPVQPENNLKFNNIGIINDSMLRPYMNTPKHLVLRALPIDSDGKKNLIHPYIVFIHEDLIAKAFDKDVPNLAILQNIPSLIKETDEGIVNLCVETVAVDSLIFKSLCREVYHRNVPTILISKSLHAIVKIEKGLKIILTPVDEQVEHPEHIEISYSNKEQQDNDIIEKFKNTIIDGTNCGKKFLVNNNMVKTNPQMTPGYIKFHLKPESMKYALLNSESLRQCTISAKSLNESDLNVQIPSTLALDYDFKNYCRTITSVEKLVHQIVTCLNFEIHREADFKNVSGIKSNVLLTGRSGTGKSSICQIVQKELTVWSHVLRCRSLKGRKDIPDVIAKAIVTCQEHGPSVLVCDDVDCLVPANMEGLSPQDSAYYQRLAVAIKRALQSCAGVAVLMTSEAVTSLHHVLSHFPGNPLFTAHFDIPEMDLEEKTNLLSHLVNDKLRSEFTVEVDDLRRLAAGEGAGAEAGGAGAGAGAGAGSVRGVTDLLHSCIFQAVKRKDPKSHEKPRLVPAARRTQARSLAAVWAPVGGLRAARQALTECLFWPLMYPRLFPSRACGVLLYGPPGAGKSHVGSCLAAARGYNFIAVKGPELLSKYIGQSEKAVRDVFDKAEMKKPCILFFDEFDSLAPKRGHDSTGVTDRVVNQLLARLDGAEGGAAGPVLCATGRPDLLDPALLRPGRLDTHVYCGMPDESDRYEVLQRLSASTRLAPGVSLRALAARAAGRSPADLRALLVTAQLRALETRLAEPDGGEPQSVEVSQEDLDFALRDTRPSLSAAQLAFYDAVYRRFRGEPLSTQDKSISSEYSQQRVTLA